MDSPLLRGVLTVGANLLGIFLAAQLDWLSYDDRFWTLLFAAAVLSLVNLVLKPLALFLSLPAILLTFGLFIFVVNAFLLWLTGEIVPSFDTLGFWKTVGAALIVSITNWAVDRIVEPRRPEREGWD